jgi:hypothetical protein
VAFVVQKKLPLQFHQMDVWRLSKIPSFSTVAHLLRLLATLLLLLLLLSHLSTILFLKMAPSQLFRLSLLRLVLIAANSWRTLLSTIL